MFIVGEIVNTHGLKGDVKVKRITDFEERFHIGSTVYVKRGSDDFEPLKIDGFRKHQQFVMLHFEGFDTIESVAIFKGKQLFIKEEQLTELLPGEYYYHEIIGCKMYTLDNDYIGEIDAILSPGANDVWVVKDEQGKEILIPYIDDVVKKVDVEQKQVHIQLIEGLIE